MAVPFTFIEHAGDAGIVARGETMRDLFINAAVAMFEIIVKGENVQPGIRRDFEVDGDDIEDLLVRWLNELNYRTSAFREVFTKFEIEHINDKHLCAVAYGEVIDPARHEFRSEIKAATYHGLYVKEDAEGFEAQVIFDL